MVADYRNYRPWRNSISWQYYQYSLAEKNIWYYRISKINLQKGIFGDNHILGSRIVL